MFQTPFRFLYSLTHSRTYLSNVNSSFWILPNLPIRLRIQTTNFDRACSLLFSIIFLVSKRVYAFNQPIAIFETSRFKCTVLFILDRSSWEHRSFQRKTRVRSKLTSLVTIERNCKSLIRSLNSLFQTLDEIFVLTHIFRGKLRKRHNDRTTSYWCSTSTFVSLASQSRRTFYYEEHASSVNTSIRLINAHNPDGSTFLNVYLPRFNNFIFSSYRPLCSFAVLSISSRNE